jgi:hypothetical protein
MRAGHLTARVHTCDPAVTGAGAVRLNCPRCGLTITPRVSWLTIEHCPRCIARSNVSVTLVVSTLTTAELDAAGEERGVRRFGALPTSQKVW